MKHLLVIFVLLLQFTPSVWASCKLDSIAQNNYEDSVAIARQDSIEWAKYLQERDSLREIQRREDSIFIAKMQEKTMEVPRYKMYKTDNIHILLKLDTRCGKAWMTQFRSSDTRSMEISIDSALSLSDESWNGRYEMYETQNMYKFIILDTFTGRTFLLQWNTEYDRRFVEPI